MLLLCQLAFLAASIYLGLHQHQDLRGFDLRRCYALHQRLHCWPKDGCWLAVNGDAICWRVVSLKRAHG